MFGKRMTKYKKVIIIANGVDTQKFTFDEKVRNNYRSLMKLEDKFVIGHIGRFAYVKNHDFLIDIFSEIIKLNPESVLLLIGQGDLEREIRDKVERLGLAYCVRFLGVRNDVHKLLQAMDVFLLPSLYEGLPVVGVEAQASGLSMVVSDAVTEEAKVLNSFAFMSLKQSAEEWAQTILKYRNGYERRNTLDEIIGAGFDATRVADELEKFYCGAI
jgi:glycosyltransferase involved in cell wall biosynthesis